MERQNLMGPYDLHLQWFADPPAPAPAPEPELKADGTFFAQASDKYKHDQKYLKDILAGEKPLKSWDGVLDRMYAAEGQLTELQAKMAPAPKKPEDYEFDELKFPDHLAGDKFAKQREGLSAYLKAEEEKWRTEALKLGVGKDLAKAVSNRFREAVFAQWKATQDQYEADRLAGVKALREDPEWRGDSFAANEEIAKRAIVTFDKDNVLATIAAEGAENHPGIIKLFHRIGKAIGEGQMVPGKAGPAAPNKEQQEAAARKARYPKSPELTKDLPAAPAAPDQAALDKMRARYPKMAAGEAGRT